MRDDMDLPTGPGITPGEWTLEGEGLPIVVLANGYPVATAHGNPDPGMDYTTRMREAVANAGLIVMAPAMADEIARLRAINANLLEAAVAAYHHMDTYGVVTGHDREEASQERVFDLLWAAFKAAGIKP